MNQLSCRVSRGRNRHDQVHHEKDALYDRTKRVMVCALGQYVGSTKHSTSDKAARTMERVIGDILRIYAGTHEGLYT